MTKTVIRAVAIATEASAVVSANSNPIPMDPYEPDFKVGFGVDFNITASAASAAGGLYTVQHTLDDPVNPNAVWFDHALSAQAANADGNLDFPVNAMRIQVQACAQVGQVVSARADLMIIQAGDMRYQARTSAQIAGNPL